MKTTREFICIPCCILLNKTKIKGICIKPLYLSTLTGHAWSVANTPVRLYVYTTMCLHHVPWYAKRATGIQTVTSSELEVYKPGAENHWRLVCVGVQGQGGVGAQQQGSHSAALYIRLSQIRKCPQEPNIILRIFSGGQSCHLISSVLSTSFPTDNTVSV